MARTIQGKLDATGGRFAVVVSRFNSFISERLLAGALDALERHGANPDDVTVIWVPGSFEIAAVTKKAAQSGKYDAILCLGALLRGDTPHFDHISATVTKTAPQLMPAIPSASSTCGGLRICTSSP